MINNYGYPNKDNNNYNYIGFNIIEKTKKVKNISFPMMNIVVTLIIIIATIIIFVVFNHSKSIAKTNANKNNEGFENKAVQTMLSEDKNIIKINSADIVNMYNKIDEENRKKLALEVNSERFEEAVEKANDHTLTNGYQYIGVLTIPRLGIRESIISKTSYDLLKISVTKYFGPDPNGIGNLVILGHNNKDLSQFGKLKQISIGDTINVKDNYGQTVQYKVYDKDYIDKYDKTCMSQNTGGKREVTLITCANYGKDRYYVKAKEF